jgi:BirA family biotin operon repressor/biotin-[acetyl-CoA-carboxylase] ligase
MFSMAIEHSMLNPAQNAHGFSKLPLQIGLAVAHAIEPLVRSQPKVKWPNDVYVEDRKICGILIESITVASTGYAIIGIGINCNVDFDQAPAQVRQNAVSVHEVLVDRDPESASCESVLLAFLQSWNQIRRWCAEQDDWIEANWAHWDWLANRRVQIEQPTRVLYGKADGIGPDGSLSLIDIHTNRHTILSGTVRVVD